MQINFYIVTKNGRCINKLSISYATLENSWTSFTMHSVPIPNFSRRTIGGPDLGTSLTHIFLTKMLRVSATASRTASPIPPYFKVWNVRIKNTTQYIHVSNIWKDYNLFSVLTYLRVVVFYYNNLSITFRSIPQDSFLVNGLDGKWVHYSNFEPQSLKFWISFHSLI